MSLTTTLRSIRFLSLALAVLPSLVASDCNNTSMSSQSGQTTSPHQPGTGVSQAGANLDATPHDRADRAQAGGNGSQRGSDSVRVDAPNDAFTMPVLPVVQMLPRLDTSTTVDLAGGAGAVTATTPASVSYVKAADGTSPVTAPMQDAAVISMDVPNTFVATPGNAFIFVQPTGSAAAKPFLVSVTDGKYDVRPAAAANVSTVSFPTTIVSGTFAVLNVEGGTASLAPGQVLELPFGQSAPVITAPSSTPAPGTPPATASASNAGSTLPVVTKFFSTTPLGTHNYVLPTDPATCPGGQFAGGVADCADGLCSGAQLYCISTRPKGELAPSDMVVVNFMTTPQVHALDGGSCPKGWVIAFVQADCSGGTCLGIVKLCAKWQRLDDALAAGAQILTGWGVTDQNVHTVDVPCPASMPSPFGSVADCGGTSCAGNQAICGILSTF